MALLTCDNETHRQPRDQFLTQPQTLGQRTPEELFGALNGIVDFGANMVVCVALVFP